jgi:hypothetical protein
MNSKSYESHNFVIFSIILLPLKKCLDLCQQPMSHNIK